MAQTPTQSSLEVLWEDHHQGKHDGHQELVNKGGPVISESTDMEKTEHKQGKSITSLMMEDQVHPCATSNRHTDVRHNWGPKELNKNYHGTGKHELQRNSTVNILTSAAEEVAVPRKEKN